MSAALQAAAALAPRVGGAPGAVPRRLALALALALLPASGAFAVDAPAAVGTTAPLLRGLPDFADLVERVGPAVVNIRTVSAPHAGVPGGADLDELLRKHFGTPDPEPAQPAPRGKGKGKPAPDSKTPGPQARPAPEAERPSQGQPDADEPRAPRGVGSGFIVGSEGEILTNAHVVADAEEVIVRFADRREFKARVIGTDKRTDVALLKIDATGLPTLAFGDADRLRVGEWVIAIGSPFDLANTVTAGIVSAKARETGELLPFIQTDVAINPGNSGGPLINQRGEVVGINSQIFSRSGGYQGISFAIPIEEAGRVAEQLREHGRVIRSRIGVQVAEVTPEVAGTLGLAGATGALVRGVEVQSPADNAGVVPGDVIVGVDAKVVDKWNDLPRIVGAGVPGGRHKVKLLRAGQPLEVTVRYAELEPEKVAAAPPAPARPVVAQAEPPRDLGITVSDITAADRRALQLDRGVQITGVEGTAARAGLRTGDILLSLGGTGIHGAEQLRAVLGRIDTAKPVDVLLRREQWVRWFVIKPRG